MGLKFDCVGPSSTNRINKGMGHTETAIMSLGDFANDETPARCASAILSAMIEESLELIFHIAEE